MQLVELYVMQGGYRDEKIAIFRIPNTPDVYRIVYKPRDGKTAGYQFQLPRNKVTDYIYDMLDLLRYDMYPYESIQVMTKHMPPVVVSMMDLEEAHVRNLIERTVLGGLDVNVKRTPA